VIDFFCTVRAFPGFLVLCHALRSLFLCCLFFSLVCILLQWSGKMETPRGRYSEEKRRKPVVLKHDRSKSNIISLHRPTSLPVTGTGTSKPHKNNEPTQRHVRRRRRDHTGREGYRENNEPTQRRVGRPRQDHAGHDRYCEDNEPMRRCVRGRAMPRRVKSTLPVEQHRVSGQDLDTRLCLQFDT